MKLYSQLSKISFLKNRYVAKFLFVAFLGIHIPLIGLVFFVVYLEEQWSPSQVFIITLVLTLIATVFTLIILKKLMAPVLKGSRALIDYKNNRIVPRLPLNYNDEAGMMLQNIQSTIQMNQKLLKEKRELFDLLTNDLREETQTTAVIIRDVCNATQLDEVKEKASQAVKSLEAQLLFVTAFNALMKEEEAIQIEQVRVKKVNLEALLNEVKQGFMPQLKNKNCKFQLHNHVSELYLKINTKLLQKAFQYLLNQTVKSASLDTDIEITTEKVHGKLMISIKYFGIGFEAKKSEKIFAKLKDNIFTTSTDYSPGIELPIVKQIVERFGGSVTAESEGIDKGCSFTIALRVYH